MVVNQQKNADYESDNVKDKNNLLPFNLWSGTDYTHTVTDERVGQNNLACDLGLNVVSSSVEWSSKGLRSYKLNLNNLNYIEYHYYDFDKTKKHIGGFDVYCGTGTTQLQLYAINWLDRSLDFDKSITIPQGETHDVMATIFPSEITTHNELRLRLKSLHNNAVIYIDNWRLLETN